MYNVAYAILDQDREITNAVLRQKSRREKLYKSTCWYIQLTYQHVERVHGCNYKVT